MSMIYDAETEKFKNQLPCVSCKFVSICKHAYEMEPIKLPEIFSVSITCREQENLMKPQRKGAI